MPDIYTLHDYDVTAGTEYDLAQKQAANWAAAQSIPLSVDLIPAALLQLRLLAAVDAHPCLYRGLAVSRAIHRYENYWLPLLSEVGHELLPLLEPPLDVAWIWHVHRLNPIVYVGDCEAHFGRILDHSSSREQSSSSFSRRYWENRFTDEPYELDLSQFEYDEQWQPEPYTEQDRLLSYDLHAAVLRQSTFYYQVSEEHMKDGAFLRTSEMRYKAFLHLFTLLRTEYNYSYRPDVFLVPTYDIDLMWHTHQLHPISYSKDTTDILGRLLGHDDSDSDRSYGSKLDKGHFETSKLWFESYGQVYHRAGAMYRGKPPSLMLPSHQPSIDTNIWPPPSSPSSLEAIGLFTNQTLVAPRKVMQVMVTIVGARNLPKRTHHIVMATLGIKDKCANLKFATPQVPLESEITWNHRWTFQAEISTMGFYIDLQQIPCMYLMKRLSKPKLLGLCHFTWEDIIQSHNLCYNGWVDLFSNIIGHKSRRNKTHRPPQLFLSVSVTTPQLGPQLFRTIRYVNTNLMGEPFLKIKRFHLFGRPIYFNLNRIVLDHANNQVFTVQAIAELCLIYNRFKENITSISIHQGGLEITDTKITHPSDRIVAYGQLLRLERLKTQRCWSVFGNSSQLIVYKDPLRSSMPILQLRGTLQDQVRLICGRKLQYEVTKSNHEDEASFVTLLRRNTLGGPPWKATALFNWKNGIIEVSPNENVALVLLFSNIIAISIFEMEGQKFKPNPKNHSQKPTSTTNNQWGSIVLPTENMFNNKSMIAYYTWWNMSTSIWSSSFYSRRNPIFGASTCGAAGACSSNTYGASVCGGCSNIHSKQTRGGGGGGCGDGGGGCGDGGGGEGGCGDGGGGEGGG